MHTRYDKRYWVISGSLTVWAGSDKVSLRSGDYYSIPMNVPHTTRAGAEGGQALIITSPAGFAEVVARAGTPARLLTPETEFDADPLRPYPPSSATSYSVRRKGYPGMSRTPTAHHGDYGPTSP